MALIESAKEILPTPWSRRVASLTGSLAVSIFLIPQWWPHVVGQDPIEQPGLLVRLFLLSSTLFLGSFVSLILVSRAYQLQEEQHAAEIESIKKENSQKLAAVKKSNDFMSKPINYPPSGLV